jgi:hypothetical protein
MLATQCDEEEDVVVDQRSKNIYEDRETMLAKTLFVVLTTKATITVIGQFLK